MTEENPNALNPALVEAVSAQLPEVTTEQVAMVLNVLNVVQSGEPLGTVMTDPATGQVAVRVSNRGIHEWRINDPGGAVIVDARPTLTGWTVIKQGEAPA